MATSDGCEGAFMPYLRKLRKMRKIHKKIGNLYVQHRLKPRFFLSYASYALLRG